MNLKTTFFERALFLSWYCSKADCAFCYMSTQKNLIRNPRRARRSFASIFAEAIISEACGWQIEFLSGGYDSFSMDELVFIAKTIREITGKKQWLNIGVLSKEELSLLKPYTEGVVGAVECINPVIRRTVCPSKPLSEILSCFSACDELGLKKGVTIIIGLGETLKDFERLEDFIRVNRITRVTFYSLNPHRGTPFKYSPPIQYYEEWVKKTRRAFHNLWITAGAWHDKTHYYSRLLRAGADNITKFPAIKLFGSRIAQEVEKQVSLGGRNFRGTLTRLPNINWDEEVDKLGVGEEVKQEIKLKLRAYLQRMKQG